MGQDAPVGYHVLPLRDFDDLARGDGGPETVDRLISAEFSRRLLLLRVLLDLASQQPELLGPLPPAAVVWQELERLQDHPESAAAIREILLHPQLGVWMSYTLRAIKRGTHDPLWPEVGQVYCAVFAAAVRSGRTMTAWIPARENGAVLLPTLGLARFPHASGPAVVRAHTIGGAASLRLDGDEIVLPIDPEKEVPGWWGLRRLETQAGGHSLRLHLDDVDPFRDLADPVQPQRLTPATVDRWHELLDEAWQILTSHLPGTAAAMAAAVKSLAPLPDSADGSTRSASTGEGFGAILTTLPPDALSMAETLVHEFQHTKLGGLLHLKDLVVEEDKACYYAPWRDDARPLAGLVQGVYAFLGITAFWRSRCLVEPDAADQFEYAFNRRQTWTAMYTLSRSTMLSPLGSRFVAGMMGRLRPWMSERVSPMAARSSWLALADHRVGWRLRNLRNDQDRVRTLAASWRTANPIAPFSAAAHAPPRPWTQRRLQLIRTQAASPERFRAMRKEDERDPDLAFVAGDAEAATEGYRSRIRENADDDDAWAGLALACTGRRHLPWRSLLRQPELVKEVTRRLMRSHGRPDPIAVAAWCDRARLQGR